MIILQGNHMPIVLICLKTHNLGKKELCVEHRGLHMSHGSCVCARKESRVSHMYPPTLSIAARAGRPAGESA